MNLTSILQNLHNNPLALTIRENELLFPWLETLHVLAITLVLGSIALVDLRLIGVRSLDRPISKISKELLPITWCAFVIAAISGAILFSSNAIGYSQNFYFLSKLFLLALAGINMVVFQLPLQARLAGLVSITLWIAIVICGRWIGFTLEPVFAVS